MATAKAKSGTRRNSPRSDKKEGPGSHVRLGLPKRGQGSLVYEVRGRGPMPSAWWSFREPPDLPEGDLVFVDQPYKGYPSLLAAKRRIRVLPLGDYLHQLVVDSDLAGRLGKLDGVNVFPTELRDSKGHVATGYCLLDVVAMAPLDRRESRARWVNGWLETLEHAAWRTEEALPPMFRLLDRPQLLFVRRDLADIISAAGKVTIDDMSSSADVFPPMGSLAKLRRVGQDREAEEAFWAYAAGDSAARTRTLPDPWWAYAVAARDRAAAADTRTGACRSPIVAALYAANIDRGVHDETRAAANAFGVSALRYATHLEYRLDPKLRPKVLDEAGYDEESLAEEGKGLEELRRWLRGEKIPEPHLIARRDWAAHDQPRYAGAPQKGETHSVVDDAVRSDIDAFVPRGYRRLGVEGEPRPEEVVEGVHRQIDAVQAGATRLAAKERVTAQMELGCAWGEQLHRALGWQWAKMEGGIALISTDRALAHYPFSFVGRLLARGEKENTVALLFNMLAAGKTPPAKPRSYVPVA